MREKNWKGLVCTRWAVDEVAYQHESNAGCWLALAAELGHVMNLVQGIGPRRLGPVGTLKRVGVVCCMHDL